MGSLIQTQSQIETLQKQAADIPLREFAKTVQQILVMMAAFSITLKDLLPAVGKAGKTGMQIRVVCKSSSWKFFKFTPKYPDRDMEKWSGRGMMPRGLAARVAHGKTRESFAVNG